MMINFRITLLSLFFIFNSLLFAKTYYVSPHGNNNAKGNLRHPWKSIQKSINKIKAGDTLMVRGGVYKIFKPIKIKTPKTSKTRPITIKAYPSEKPILDASLYEFSNVPNKAWKIVDAKHHIYRSKKRFYNIRYLSAFLSEAEKNYALVVYKDKAPFFSNNQNYPGSKRYYVGPGIYYDRTSHFIYIRMQHSKYQNLLINRLPNLRGLKKNQDFNFPRITDPRKTKLHIGIITTMIHIQVSHVNISGLTIKNTYSGVYINPNLERIKIRSNNFQPRYYGIIVRENSKYINITRNKVDCHIPNWIARSDIKRPRETMPPAKSYHGAGIELADGKSHNINIFKNTIQNCFDAVHLAQTFHDIHIHHNKFFNIRDDAVHMGSASYNIEIDHNKMIGVYLGVSYHGRDKKESKNVGTTFIHHNIIDTSTPQFLGRADPKNLFPPFMHGFKETGWGSGRPFGSHDATNIVSPDPWKIYNNTLIAMDGGDRLGFGQCYRHDIFDPKKPHEVYNNIFLMYGDHYLGRDCRLTDGSTKMDGNLYWKIQKYGKVIKPFFYNYDDKAFKNLKILKKKSKNKWEKHGVEADPKLNNNYAPSSTSRAAKGAVNISNATWWKGKKSDTFRGAIPPQ